MRTRQENEELNRALLIDSIQTVINDIGGHEINFFPTEFISKSDTESRFLYYGMCYFFARVVELFEQDNRKVPSILNKLRNWHIAHVNTNSIENTGFTEKDFESYQEFWKILQDDYGIQFGVKL